MKIKVEDIRYKAGGKEILKGISFEVKTGRFTGVIGPNGSGKSTILKLIYGVDKGYRGRILLGGREMREISSREKAREIAVLPQDPGGNADFSVREMVKMGRYPHRGFFENYSPDDQKIVEESLLQAGIEELGGRGFGTLSGGEKQRVLIARAMAQRAGFLILDEPTNHLDIRCQMKLMKFIKDQQLTVLSAIHDLNMAAMYCDDLIVVKEGRVVKTGSVEEVLTEELIREVFGVTSYIGRNPLTQKLQIYYGE